VSRCAGFIECSHLGCSCDEPRDVPACAHCEADLDPSELIETAAGLDCCSTLCAVALCTFNHPEHCRRPECSDYAPLTLPQMLCCCCDAPSETTAHAGCREKLRNAFALQDGARVGATS
jgi:hypothetical protein